MFGKLIFVLLVTLATWEISSASTSKFLCYHGSWAKYRTGNGKFNVSDIDTSYCTHLIYSFIGVTAEGSVVSLDTYLDYTLGNLEAFTSLKSTRTDLKVLVAIGGWNQGSVNFSTVTASASLRAVFIQSALEFVQKYNFDGLDIDWEYPARRGGCTEDVNNFVTLLKELKVVFESYDLLVTAAVSATASTVAESYNVTGIAEYLDFISVMTYDLHTYSDGVTGHNAPLYASSIDTTAAALQLNVEACISNWLAQGAPAEKIVLGIPFYGRTFTLASSTDVALGAPTTGAGTAGPYTQEAGYLGYNEIVEKIVAGGWTYVWDDEQQVPHMYSGNQWVGFDDTTSVTLKVSFAQANNLGGVMVWSIETDDFHGISGTKNPLLKAITTQLGIGNSTTNTTTTSSTTSATKTTTTTTTTASTTTSSTASTTTASTTTTTAATAVTTNSSVCTKVGFARNSTNCEIFYYCLVDLTGHLTAKAFTCPCGLYFDLNLNACNWASLVTGCS